MSAQREQLVEYRVRARNISADSENKIHDDTVAGEYGFRGGLVPGVAVYAYMTVPIVTRFGLDWLERGAISVRFRRPFYEGERVIVKAETSRADNAVRIDVTTSREDGELCATAVASLPAELEPNRYLSSPTLELETRPLPSPDFRLAPCREELVPGTKLGTLIEELDLVRHRHEVLSAIEERLQCYFGADAVPHPIITLSLANHVLMQNVALGPWIHSSSDVVNSGLARDGDTVSVHGRIEDCFERSGHEFVVLDLLFCVHDRLINRVRHTAIYKIRRRA